MANQSYMNFEDEDENQPYNQVSGTIATPDFAAEAAAQQQEPQPQASSSPDPLIRQMIAKRATDFSTNLGEAFGILAQGSNAPKPTKLYEHMNDQGKENIEIANKVKNAIEARKMHQTVAKDRKRRDDLKYEDHEKMLAVPGYERTGEVLPKPEEAQKFRSATASAKNLTNMVSQLDSLVDEVGSFEYGGTKGQEMKSVTKQIQLLLKNQDMFNLGVLTGPDMGILESIVADPDSFQSLMTRDSTRKAQISALLKSIKAKTASTAASLGYKEAAAQGMSASDEENLSKMDTGLVPIKAPNGVIRNIPKNQVEAALKSGGQRI